MEHSIPHQLPVAVAVVVVVLRVTAAKGQILYCYGTISAFQSKNGPKTKGKRLLWRHAGEQRHWTSLHPPIWSGGKAFVTVIAQS